jgi:hypothetical protein
MGECEIVTPKACRLYLELYVKLPPWQGCSRILILRLRRTPRGGSGTDHGHESVAQVELLKLQKSGEFPDESVKIKGAQIHYVVSQTYYQKQV